MWNIIQIVLNYIWFLIKLILFSSAISIPLVVITYLAEDIFKKINIKRKNFFISLFIIIYSILFIVILIAYFTPIILNGFQLNFWSSVLFTIFQIIRLAITNILLSAMLLILAIICSAIYEKINKNKNIKNLNLIKLWISSTITTIIGLFIILIFPNLMAIIIYLIYNM